MQNLALKYRPKVYEDIVGQDLFVRFLRNLSKKQIGRNLVLFGPWGSGKTSSFRIYAKTLNCLNLTPEGNPCYSCEACLDNSSILELDAASSSGKEDIKDILEIARVPPLIGKYRVIIADEAQQFSKAAWDSLLKSIEEPKPFQVFLFSTTEIGKVRDAIKSRCQCLEVKTLSHKDAKEHLVKICKAEGFVYEDQALDILCFLSKGHPRDLLKNLEQVSFLGDISTTNCQIIFNLAYLEHLLLLVGQLTDPTPPCLHPALKSFEETPKTILEFLRQFHLFLYYTFLHKTQMDINPLFALIPEGDLQAYWGRYEVLLEGDPVVNFQKILCRLDKVQDQSFSSLEIGLISYHNYLHVQKFQDSAILEQKVSQTSVAPRTLDRNPKKKGRQFVTVQPVIPPLLQEKEKPPVSSSKPEVAEVLVKQGFVLKKNFDLTIFEEEAGSHD